MKNCYHCGEPCTTITIEHDDKVFCCNGCKTVFDILNDNELLYYYDLEQNPGTSPNSLIGKFDFLENEQIVEKLLEFNEQNTQVVSLLIPSIHCSSCIWVLENLNKLIPAVKTSQVNFPKKTIRITFSSEESNLKTVVQLLAKIGYAPYISLDDASEKKTFIDRSLIYKLGVAGFAFGNIMFLSFPEYFEISEFWLEKFKHVFRWLMFAFAIPVVAYSARDYFISAYKGLRSKMLNIDVPIAIGISVLFIRSSIEIALDIGTGFFDSMAGLVFFLLVGKFFQQKTYSFLSFERDYKSYFPIAVTRLKKTTHKNGNSEEQAQVYELKKGDRILIRHEELLPVDAILIKGNAQIDYSFVTGEAAPVEKHSGDQLFAGGRQQGGAIEIEVLKPVEQSYLTQLWSNEIFSKNKQSTFENLTDAISRRFTISLLIIAIIATITWLFINPSMALNVFTAVLIVACPCAIALAAPFTLGNLLRIFGRNKLYLKDTSVIEQLAGITTVVFDKTGTLTSSAENTVQYQGTPLNDTETTFLTSALRSSNHPLSRLIYDSLDKTTIINLDQFTETVGQGIIGSINNTQIKIGAYAFVTNGQTRPQTPLKTEVHVSINNVYKGNYSFYNNYRESVNSVFSALKKTVTIAILSGDNDGELGYLKSILPENTALLFNQKPKDKLNYIKLQQEKGEKVLMIGDGLNDAGALAQSNVGISISENINVFSPACDGILDASQFKNISSFIHLSHQGVKIIKYAFLFSLVYNFVGLCFAVTGNLAPVVAAILMPLSSISIVFFTTIATYIVSKKELKSSF